MNHNFLVVVVINKNILCFRKNWLYFTRVSVTCIEMTKMSSMFLLFVHNQSI